MERRFDLPWSLHTLAIGGVGGGWEGRHRLCGLVAQVPWWTQQKEGQTILSNRYQKTDTRQVSPDLSMHRVARVALSGTSAWACSAQKWEGSLADTADTDYTGIYIFGFCSSITRNASRPGGAGQEMGSCCWRDSVLKDQDIVTAHTVTAQFNRKEHRFKICWG